MIEPFRGLLMTSLLSKIDNLIIQKLVQRKWWLSTKTLVLLQDITYHTFWNIKVVMVSWKSARNHIPRPHISGTMCK